MHVFNPLRQGLQEEQVSFKRSGLMTDATD